MKILEVELQGNEQKRGRGELFETGMQIVAMTRLRVWLWNWGTGGEEQSLQGSRSEIERDQLRG